MERAAQHEGRYGDDGSDSCHPMTLKAATAEIVTETRVMMTMRTVKGMKVTVTKVRLSNGDRIDNQESGDREGQITSE